MLTEQEYVKKGGLHCPNCNSEDLQSGSLEVDSGICYCRTKCLKCKSAWDENYALVDYSNFKIGVKP